MRISNRTTLNGTAASLLMMMATGCAGLGDLQQEIARKELVHDAYRCEQAEPGSVKYARHFERGWRQGYYDVTKGGDGCPPSVPPQQYWTVKYQNAEGCRQIATWYNGYRRGVTAARRDGRHLYSGVPVGAVCERPRAHECFPIDELRTYDIVESDVPVASEITRADVPPNVPTREMPVVANEPTGTADSAVVADASTPSDFGAAGVVQPPVATRSSIDVKEQPANEPPAEQPVWVADASATPVSRDIATSNDAVDFTTPWSVRPPTLDEGHDWAQESVSAAIPGGQESLEATTPEATTPEATTNIPSAANPLPTPETTEETPTANASHGPLSHGPFSTMIRLADSDESRPLAFPESNQNKRTTIDFADSRVQPGIFTPEHQRSRHPISANELSFVRESHGFVQPTQFIQRLPIDDATEQSK